MELADRVATFLSDLKKPAIFSKSLPDSDDNFSKDAYYRAAAVATNPLVAAYLSGMAGAFLVGTWVETYITQLHVLTEKRYVLQENKA